MLLLCPSRTKHLAWTEVSHSYWLNVNEWTFITLLLSVLKIFNYKGNRLMITNEYIILKYFKYFSNYKS